MITKKNIKIGIAGLLGTTLLFGSFTTVPSGHRGVITTLGAPKETVYSEGFHFKVPFIQTMYLVNVAIQNNQTKAQAASRDLQIVHADVLLNYHINPDKAVYIYRELANDADNRIVSPSLQEALKAVTARYTAEELIGKRVEVRDAIIASLHDRLQRHGLVVDEFSITNFNFSQSFNEAIEAKTTAEQLKLKAERDLQRIQIEAEQKIATAKAEAESLKSQRQEITQELLELRRVQNEAAAIEKWNGVLPIYSGDTVPLINFGK